MKVRVYPAGEIVFEDDFEEIDNSLPYYDDYSEEEFDDDMSQEEIEKAISIKEDNFWRQKIRIPAVAHTSFSDYHDLSSPNKTEEYWGR